MRRYNAECENGYAAIHLRKEDGSIDIFDGHTGNTTPSGEFVAFTCVVGPALDACMQVGLQALTVDATFVPVCPDINLHIVDGFLPSTKDLKDNDPAKNNVSLVPIVLHLDFGESEESYVHLWKFLEGYENGKVAAWMDGVIIRRNPESGLISERFPCIWGS